MPYSKGLGPNRASVTVTITAGLAVLEVRGIWISFPAGDYAFNL